jgi:hypothetical protein
MAHDKSSDPTKIAGEQLLKNSILLALPWLSLQRDMLAIGRRGIQDYSHIRPLQNFTLREMQALMMVLDPSGTWRNSFSGLETRLQKAPTESISKLMSGLSDLMESQETMLNSMIEGLNSLKNGSKAKRGE